MFIGIDLGTSGVKSILVTKDGSIKKSVSRTYDLVIPKPSWSEQDPNIWYQETISSLKELVAGYENEIQGISFSGQMHGLVILDENDIVLRNAILWNDQRTVKEVDYLNKEIGIEKLLDETGNIALTGLTAPKLLWVMNNEPEIFKKIRKVMLPKDYLVYKLSGEFVSDVSDLSGTLYFDCKNRKYSDYMLEVLKLDRSVLPEIFESYEVVGYLKKELKQLLNINQDVKIIAGGGDQAVGAVGVGIVGDGECSISLGTSGVVFVSSNTFNVDKKSHLQSYAHANGKYHVMAVMLNAAGALKWWNEDIFDDSNYDLFFERISVTKIEESLFFLPYLSGERSPINDPFAKGVIFGLGNHHTKPQLDRAIVEGVTFALRDSFELIKNLGTNIQRIRITGGGSKSDVWAQMISDIFNVEVIKIDVDEGPALGAAILAMVGCNEYSNVEDACNDIVKLKSTFYPKFENFQLYDSKYKKFVKIYPRIKELYND